MFKSDEVEAFKEKTDDRLVSRCPVVLLCVEHISEKVARVMRKHQVHVALRAVKTLKTLLVHPKDRQEKEEITDSYG